MNFAYVLARDQNHILRDKNLSDLFDVFLLFFEKVIKIQAKWQKGDLYVFLF